jgi:hypothetical protein
MYVLLYDPTGRVFGSTQLADGAQLSTGYIACTAEQAANLAAYSVDTATQTIVAIDPGTVLQSLKASLVTAIDTRVADIYSTWSRFQQEYLLRAAAAQAFKDTDYMGTPSTWITDFARPAGKTVVDATNLILAQSANLNAALGALGALRMRKYEILAATDTAGAQAAHDTVAALIDQTAAAIQ